MKKIEKKTLNKIIKITCIVLAVVLVATGGGFGIKYYVDGLVPKDTHNAIQSLKVAKGENEIRVMSSNLLNVYGAQNSKNSRKLRKSSARPRSKIFFEILDTYKPDVIGLQEICNDWYDELIKNDLGYEFLLPGETRDDWHMTCMIYNSKTTKLLEKENFILKDLDGNTKGRDGDRYRRVEWGLFEDIATGKQYIVTSTHFDFIGGANSKTVDKLALMKSEANELFDLVNRHTEKYNVPIYMTGDYNTVNNIENWKELWPERSPENIEKELVPQKDKLMANQAPEIYNYLCEKLIDTKLVSKEFKAGGTTTIESPTYDHIFTNSENEISRYVILSDKSMLKLSDHYMTFADVKL